MTRQQFRLTLGNLREPALKRLGDASVKRASRLAQQRAVGSVLHKCVLEQISRVRGQTLPEEQTCINEPVEYRAEFLLPLVGYRSYQSMGKLSPDHRSNLCHLLGRTEPIKPRHQRSVQACRDRH